VSSFKNPSALKNRSGSKVSGFGYIPSSRLIALEKDVFPTGKANIVAEAYHEFGKTIVPNKKLSE
jgi:hypothetical protein